ncbi:MAG: hypothetical protein J7K48_05975 [Thermococcus sp.]|nr:hypothetical protein [Thermococcus sp.]
MEDIFEVLPLERIAGVTVSVIYDAYSSAWQVLFLFIRKALQMGYFTVISNYSVPLKSLMHRFNSVGVNPHEALENDKLAIVDVFGSRYSPVREEIKNVFYLDKVEPETINPKIDRIYLGPLRDKLTGNAMRMIYTLDGASIMLGEEQTLKLLNQTIAHKSISFPESTLFLPLNADMVSKRFVAWISNLSDYVLLAKSWIREDHVKELLYFIKAPHPDFEPAVYSLRVSKGREKIMLKKLSAPELGSPAEEER